RALCAASRSGGRVGRSDRAIRAWASRFLIHDGLLPPAFSARRLLCRGRISLASSRRPMQSGLVPRESAVDGNRSCESEPMEHPGFFERSGPFPLAEVARASGAELAEGVDGARLIGDVKSLAEAASGHVSFLDNRKYLPQLETTRATACFVAPAFASRVPAGTAALITKTPYRAFALALQLFYPDALRPKVARGGSTTLVDPSAQLEEGVSVEPGAVIGPEAQIGRGTVVAAGAV